MGKWLVLAGLLLPLAAHAAPIGASPIPTYQALAPAPLAGPSTGWGFRATLHGRSLDMSARDQGWTPDPTARPGDMEAGFGWRGASASAVLGYSQLAIGPHFDPRARPREDFASDGQTPHTGVLGLSLVLHTR